jgi:hypothetical protein
VELATNAIDVDERKWMGMSAVGQQNEDAFVERVNPTTGAGKTGMTKAAAG